MKQEAEKEAPASLAPTQPSRQSETWEDTSSPNPYHHTITCKIYLPKQIQQHMRSLISFKRERLKLCETKQQSPEFQQLKQKVDAYKKLDDKSKDEERKKNSDLYRATVDMEAFNSQRQKASFTLFEPFQDRGKHPYVRFSHRRMKGNHNDAGELQVRLNKHYVLQELKVSRSSILNLPRSFVLAWQSQMMGMMKNICRLSNETQKSPFYPLYIKSVDLISITFDIQYGDKRIYRFRYSPFEFRSGLFIRNETLLSGYNQTISVIPEINNLKLPFLDSDFYNAPRCFIFDDLTDSNLSYKLLQRTNLFYMAYSISRGITNFYQNSSPVDSDEYCKKYLWSIYFSTTRLKKFIYTWSFKPFKKARFRQEYFVRETQLSNKQIVFHVPFYVELRDGKDMHKDDPIYKLRVQYQQPTKQMPEVVKSEIMYLTREWYTYFRQAISSRDYTRDKHIIEQERIAQMNRKDREPEKPDREQTQLQMLFSSRDRFDRFLVGFLVIVSTIIDRNHFIDERALKSSSDNKMATLDTAQIRYVSEKNSTLLHYHWIEIQLEHKILPHLFPNKEEKQRLHRSHDLKIKCGEWRLSRLVKLKREWNTNPKHNKGIGDFKSQDIQTFPEIIRVYVQILLRHFPLRYIYKDIVNFISGMARSCYSGWQQGNALELNQKNQSIFVPIISAILSLYYFSPLTAYKERDQKAREKMLSQTHADRHQRQGLNEDEKSKREERLIDQFTKAVVIKILSKGDPGFMSEEKLLAEVTFRLMDFKMCWLTRVREGVIMLRVFEDRVQIEKEYERVQVVRYWLKGSTVALQQGLVREHLQRLTLDLKQPLIL